jgi:hypothetical protein
MEDSDGVSAGVGAGRGVVNGVSRGRGMCLAGQ